MNYLAQHALGRLRRRTGRMGIRNLKERRQRKWEKGRGDRCSSFVFFSILPNPGTIRNVFVHRVMGFDVATEMKVE